MIVGFFVYRIRRADKTSMLALTLAVYTLAAVKIVCDLFSKPIKDEFVFSCIGSLFIAAASFAEYWLLCHRITMSIYRQETTSSTVAICKQNFYIIQLCHEQDLGLSTFFAFLIYQFLQLDNFSCAYIFCLISVQNKHTIFCTPLERATHPRALPFWGSPRPVQSVQHPFLSIQESLL